MGYETTLVLTEAYTETERDWSHGVIATVDLCKTGRLVHGVISAGEVNPKWGYFAEDGNTLITRDNYNEPIRSVDVSSILSAMESEGLEYRRYRMAHGLLQAAKETFGDRLRVFSFGH